MICVDYQLLSFFKLSIVEDPAGHLLIKHVLSLPKEDEKGEFNK